MEDNIKGNLADKLLGNNVKLASSFEDFMETTWQLTAEQLQKETTIAGQAQINAVVWMNKIYRNSLQCLAVIRFSLTFLLIKLHIIKAPLFKSSKPIVVTGPTQSVAGASASSAPTLSVVPNTNVQD